MTFISRFFGCLKGLKSPIGEIKESQLVEVIRIAIIIEKIRFHKLSDKWQRRQKCWGLQYGRKPGKENPAILTHTPRVNSTEINDRMTGTDWVNKMFGVNWDNVLTPLPPVRGRLLCASWCSSRALHFHLTHPGELHSWKKLFGISSCQWNTCEALTRDSWGTN